MPSRDLNDLLPDVAHKARLWLERCRARGVEPLVYCTYRAAEEQDELFARGRTTPGVPCRHGMALRPVGTCAVHPFGWVVTNARGWQSWHNVRRAWDAVPMVGGKPLWEVDLRKPLPWPWHVMVNEADAAPYHIEWAGRWTTFKEAYHFQITDGMTLAEAQLQHGGIP